MRSAFEHRSDTIATSSTAKAGPPHLAGFASIVRTAVEKPATTGNDIIHDFTTGVDMIDHCNLTPTNLQSAVRQHVYSGLYAWGLIAVSLLARNQPAMTATRALKCLHVTHTESCTAKCSFRVADKGQKKTKRRSTRFPGALFHSARTRLDGCVAVGSGGSGPVGRATPHLAEPTLRCHAVPCRDQSSSAPSADFLGRPSKVTAFIEVGCGIRRQLPTAPCYDARSCRCRQLCPRRPPRQREGEQHDNQGR